MYCSNCGKEIKSGMRFCPGCGQPVKSPGTSVDLKQVATNAGRKTGEAVSNFANQLDRYTGGEGHVELKFKDLFSNAFKKHSREEADEIFACGSKSTTPAPENISKEWPRPWFYLRAFLALSVTFALMSIAWIVFHGANMLPGMMITGAMLIPVPILIFYFECNSPRNISFVTVLEMLFVGGSLSIIFTFLIDQFLQGGVGELGPSMVTGFVEEIGKALAICVFIAHLKDKNYILNGILMGGAVGTGFAVFETAGYIFNEFIASDYSTSAMMNIIVVRSLLAFGGHVAWAAVTGAAIMIALNHKRYTWTVLFRWKFIRIFLLNVILHGLWDTAFSSNEVLEIMKDFFLGVVAWIVIGVMLNRELNEINLITAQSMKRQQASIVGKGSMPQHTPVYRNKTMPAPNVSVSGRFQYCPDCGAELPKYADYCPNCGKKIGMSSADIMHHGEDRKSVEK